MSIKCLKPVESPYLNGSGTYELPCGKCPPCTKALILNRERQLERRDRLERLKRLTTRD